MINKDLEDNNYPIFFPDYLFKYNNNDINNKNINNKNINNKK